MYTEMSLKEALKYFMKGRKVLVLNEYDDKSISAESIEDCLPKEAKYLVDVPAVPNPEFEQAVQDMVEPDQNENDTEGGCDYCIHTGKERGCDVKVCDKAVEGPRLTRK